jgi:hypothetical protein
VPILPVVALGRRHFATSSLASFARAAVNDASFSCWPVAPIRKYPSLYRHTSSSVLPSAANGFLILFSNYRGHNRPWFLYSNRIGGSPKEHNYFWFGRATQQKLGSQSQNGRNPHLRFFAEQNAVLSMDREIPHPKPLIFP